MIPSPRLFVKGQLFLNQFSLGLQLFDRHLADVLVEGLRKE
jgi:hypothetical protein